MPTGAQGGGSGVVVVVTIRARKFWQLCKRQRKSKDTPMHLHQARRSTNIGRKYQCLNEFVNTCMSFARHTAHNSHPSTAPAQNITTQHAMVMTPPTSAERCDSMPLLVLVDAGSSILLRRVSTLGCMTHAMAQQEYCNKGRHINEEFAGAGEIISCSHN